MKRPRSHNNGSSPIKSLPRDMLVEVVARVASDSVDDLCSIKKCCKDFLGASEDKRVWQHVSLDKFPLLPWFPNHKTFSFFQRCRESGNIEILYREALREFFNYPNGNISGLKMVAQENHMEAKYIYGMILLCSHDDVLRKEGFEYMRFLRKSKCIVRCRNNVKKFAGDLIWKGKGMLVRNEIPLCRCKNTCKGWGLKKAVESNGYGMGIEIVDNTWSQRRKVSESENGNGISMEFCFKSRLASDAIPERGSL
ncbi:hypothetical protein Fmac_000555 [Flemingia macrophylla]|uniref:At2g35280-like TPR domain-containing protein n=1 Tax=Flemingia macrophylla TaxID=520843 RepID=A0ABD1NEK7_9FABA